MAIHAVKYTHTEKEFEEMRVLLTDSYRLSRKPLNWRLAMAENWNHASRYLEPLEYFTSRAHLWRNDGGELVGFLIRDNFLVYPQVQSGYRDLESEMFDWAERNWGTEKAQVNTMVYDWDSERQDMLTQRGYENLGAIEDVRIYDLNRKYPKPSLPPSFQVRSMAEYGDSKARIDLENSVWGATLDEAWFKGKSSAPSYSPHLDLVAISPDGKLAAASLVWLYPENKTAEIDPLGTHPDYRRRGLARALVLESFKRMRSHEMQYAYIASFAKDPIVSHLYSSLQPIEAYQGFHWVKQV
jgi:mycothiol synthase